MRSRARGTPILYTSCITNPATVAQGCIPGHVMQKPILRRLITARQPASIHMYSTLGYSPPPFPSPSPPPSKSPCMLQINNIPSLGLPARPYPHSRAHTTQPHNATMPPRLPQHATAAADAPPAPPSWGGSSSHRPRFPSKPQPIIPTSSRVERRERGPVEAEGDRLHVLVEGAQATQRNHAPLINRQGCRSTQLLQRMARPRPPLLGAHPHTVQGFPPNHNP
jgi:hypothetical protein